MTETKRDVLVNAVDALADAQASSDNNVGLGHQDADLFMAEYEKALPDDLPTILECVSKEIKAGYGKYSLLDELAWANQDALPSSKVSEWINDNESLFAEAWSRGLWVVEETGEVTSYDD